MSAAYLPAQDARRIAADLIPAHHPHLEDAPLRYVLREPPAKKNNRARLGVARVVSGLGAYFAGITTALSGRPSVGPFGVVELAATHWNELLNDSQRRALVDHELCHFAYDGERLTIMGHDVEEFEAVIRRHGLWSTDLFDLVSAGADQLRLEEPLT